MLTIAARNFAFEVKRRFNSDVVAAMSATVSADLLDELEVVLKGSSAERSARTLLRLSDLLRSCAERLSPSQIGVFDDVLVRLLDCVGVRTSPNSALLWPISPLHRSRPFDNSPVTAIRLSPARCLPDRRSCRTRTSSRSRKTGVSNIWSQSPIGKTSTRQLTDVMLKMAGRDASRHACEEPVCPLLQPRLCRPARGSRT